MELSIPRADAGYSVFIGWEGKLYSVTANGLNGHVILFDASVPIFQQLRRLIPKHNT